MSNDPRIVEQAQHLTLAEPRNSLKIKARKHLAKTVPFSQDCQPRKPTLEPFEADFFEQTVVVGRRASPLVVVIGEIVVVTDWPITANDTVRRRFHPVECNPDRPFGPFWPLGL